VGGVVVNDEVNVQVRRHRRVDRVEKLLELDCPVTAMTAADDVPALHVLGRDSEVVPWQT